MQKYLLNHLICLISTRYTSPEDVLYETSILGTLYYLIASIKNRIMYYKNYVIGSKDFRNTRFKIKFQEQFSETLY